MPGIAASTSDTCELGSPPKAVEAPENNFDCEVTCACTSMPMTTSQSPVAPLISFDFFTGAFIAGVRFARCLNTSHLFTFGRRLKGLPQGCRSSEWALLQRRN